jgi:hypothetical protein
LPAIFDFVVITANSLSASTWELTQANKLPENTPLVAGQRVVIPRHQMPLIPAAGPVSQKR